MRYNESTPLASTPITGSPASITFPRLFIPWQPSTWPEVPNQFNEDFHRTLEIIFRETITDEIDNVIGDALSRENGSLEHRGHVVAISQLCAIDALASYAFSNSSKVGKRYKSYIANFFPKNYRPHATEIYNLYRNAMVHGWNLFEVGIYPGNEALSNTNGTLKFGLLHFQESIKISLENFLEKLKTDIQLQDKVVRRYKKLRKSARP